MKLDEEIIDVFMLGIGQTPGEFARKIKRICAKHFLEEIEEQTKCHCEICREKCISLDNIHIIFNRYIEEAEE